jgi:anaerobic magnesium-protoporphyrin IX monomethyl ester cyclase
MRVALVGSVHEENLALGYLHASLTQAGHTAELFGFPAPERFEEAALAIVARAPDVVALSMVFTIRALDFVRFAALLCEKGFRGHVTCGGTFATLHARQLLEDAPGIDSVLHGEGEEALVDLVEHLGQLEQVKGMTWRLSDGAIANTGPRETARSLDGRSWPTRPAELDRYLGLPAVAMLASRGCYASCRFCSIAAWHQHIGGARLRLRSEADIAAEMGHLFHRRGVRLFNFHDDTFFLPRPAASVARLRALRRELDGQGVGRIAVQVKARPDCIDAEVVKALVELGCFRVFLGVETNSSRGLEALGRGVQGAQNHAALRMLLEAGLHVSFNLLTFEPGSTVDDVRQNIDFIRAYPQVPLNICRTEVYGGTPLEADLLAEGRLRGSYFGYDYRLRDAAAQRVVEVFRVVFHGRNFLGTGMNLRAMALDHQLHLLRHFWPERAAAPLAAQVKGLVGEVNASNAELLERACDFAQTGPGDEATQAFARAMLVEREALDERLFARADALLLALGRAAGCEVGDEGTPGLSRGVGRMPAHVGGGAKTEVLVVLGLTILAGVGIITFFGDNIRRLFGMSTELAGEVSIERRRPGGGAGADGGE